MGEGLQPFSGGPGLHLINALGQREDFTPELLKTETEALAAQWSNLFVGRTRSELN